MEIVTIVIGKIKIDWESKIGKPYMQGNVAQARVAIQPKDKDIWVSQIVFGDDPAMAWKEGQSIQVQVEQNAKGYWGWEHVRKVPTRTLHTTNGTIAAPRVSTQTPQTHNTNEGVLLKLIHDAILRLEAKIDNLQVREQSKEPPLNF